MVLIAHGVSSVSEGSIASAGAADTERGSGAPCRLDSEEKGDKRGNVENLEEMKEIHFYIIMVTL